MSSREYAPDKILAHPDRLKILREGGHPAPLHLHLILSDLCNLDCPGCAYRMSGYSSNQLFPGPNGERNPNRMLGKGLVGSVLEDCAAMGTKAIEFTGGGEPLVHPDALSLINYAQHLGLDTALITNGILLRKEVDGIHAGDVALGGQWVRISLDAASRSTFASVRPGLGGQNYFDRVVENIRWLVDRKREFKSNTTIGIGFVVQRDNWYQIYDAVELAYSLGVDNIRISGLFSPEGDAYHARFREAAEELECKAHHDFDGRTVWGRSTTFRVHARYGEKISDLAAPPDYSKCHYQRVTTYLGADANLYRCCVTSYNRHGLLGNVRDSGGFRKLWESEAVRAELDCFDARSCSMCQFNDRNRAIDEAIVGEDRPVSGLVHPYFV